MAVGTIGGREGTAPRGGRVAASLAICAAVMFVDGYDLAAMPLALPHLSHAWGLPPERFGVALSAVLAGLGAGALLLGPIGDRIGRRLAVAAGLVVLGLATVGTALAHSLAALALWRLLTGLALGLCLPNCTAFTAEAAPPRIRAGIMTAISCALPVGGVVAGFVAPALIGAGGWPALFIVSGGTTLVLALAAWVCLPRHSPQGAARPTALPVLAPLARGYRWGSAVFVGLYTLNALTLYLLASWLPTVLPMAGFALADGARLASLVQAGGLVGGLGLSLLLDRGYAVAALVGGYLLVIAALVTLGFLGPNWWVWAALLLVVGCGTSGAHLALMAVGASFYPSAMLSSAIGLAVAVARLGAIAGPMIGASLIAAHVSPAMFLRCAAIPVGLCTLGVLLVPTVRRHLD